MRHGSLFSGGGGFDLAAEMMGWENVFHCEKDEFCQTILKHYWPNAATYSDIKEFNAKKYRGTIDILTGGFPCQPFSNAGKRKGTGDDRYLWPDMLRVIREIQPPWVVGENVYGLVSWEGGLVFDQVQSDLEAQGYEVQAYVLPAAGVNAPHQRYRVWIVAYNPRYAAKRKKKAYTNALRPGRHKPRPDDKTKGRGSAGRRGKPDGLCEAQLASADSNANSDGLQWSDRQDEKQPGKTGQHAQRHVEPLGGDVVGADGERSRFDLAGKDWRDWPTQSPLCCGNDGLSTQLDGIAFSKWRAQSIKMFGNAILPQVALRIFRVINNLEKFALLFE